MVLLYRDLRLFTVDVKFYAHVDRDASSRLHLTGYPIRSGIGPDIVGQVLYAPDVGALRVPDHFTDRFLEMVRFDEMMRIELCIIV